MTGKEWDLWFDKRIEEFCQKMAFPTSVNEVIGVESPIVRDAENPAKKEFGKHLNNIAAGYKKVNNLLKKIISGKLNEDSFQNDLINYETAFNEIKSIMKDIYSSLNVINAMRKENVIDVDVLNWSIRGIHSSLLGINNLIEGFNKGKAPEWLLKNNSSACCVNDNFKIQIVYYACIDGANWFLRIIEDIKKTNNEVRIPFDLNSLNLMKNADSEAVTAITQSDLVKSLKEQSLSLVKHAN